MQFLCDVHQHADGRWTMRHTGSSVGQVAVTAATRAEAAERMRKELHYRLELCPCTGETYSDVGIELVERMESA
ncbi:MAG TPA: hypothetical protein VML55_18070 [Planctomycetaceae bacterium]|nr:hypothetical protein [Planctomycetaceae bacterium]